MRHVTMRRASWILLTIGALTLASRAYAESVPEITWLLPGSLEALGFSVEILDETGGTLVTMKGPRVGPNGCPAARIGSAFFLPENPEPMVGSALVGESKLDPVAHVSFGAGAERVSIYMDYLCADGGGVSRRYAIRNVSLFR